VTFNPTLREKKYSELTADVRRFVDRDLIYQAHIVKNIDDPRNPEHQTIATEIFWRLQQGESLNYMEVAHSRLSSLVRNLAVKYADDQRFDYVNYMPIDGNPDKHPFFRVIDRNNNRMQHLALMIRLLILEEQDGPSDIRDAKVMELVENNQRADGIGNWSMESTPHAKRMLRTLRRFYEIFKDDSMILSHLRSMACHLTCKRQGS
jgi:hypothetical protein